MKKLQSWTRAGMPFWGFFPAVVLISTLQVPVVRADAVDPPKGSLPKSAEELQWESHCAQWRTLKSDWNNIFGKNRIQNAEDTRQIDAAIECVQLKLGVLGASITDQAEKLGRASDQTVKGNSDLLAQLNSTLAEERGVLSELVKRVGTLSNEYHTGNGTKGDPNIVLLSQQLTIQQDALQSLSTYSLQLQASVDALTRNLSAANLPGPQQLGVALAPPHNELQLNSDIKQLYGGQRVNVGFAIVTLPDPTVPRHQRAYDTELAALTQGMIRAEFVLDDFNFPWDSDPETVAANRGAASPKSVTNAEITATSKSKEKYGLMIFRRDTWRRSGSAIDLRALYIVPERATFGVSADAFRQAVARIVKQNPVVNGIPVTIRVPGYSATVPKDVLVFGPSFSGSMDSLVRATLPNPQGTAAAPRARWVSFLMQPAEETDDTDFGKVRIRALSTSATAYKNRLAPALDYSSMTFTDDEKMQALTQLADALKVGPCETAVIYESTVFGLDAAEAIQSLAWAGKNDRTVQCDTRTTSTYNNQARHVDGIPVPVNIADVRYGFAAREAAVSAKAPIELPELQDHLPLNEGAENGTEFPREASLLTPTSSELGLQAVLDRVRKRSYRLVAVAATDVRDRLFLFDKLRAALPGAMFVDLGTDRLLSHSNFVHASRGALTLGSRDLDTCDGKSGASSSLEIPCAASTDYQSLLATAIERWAQSPGKVPSRDTNEKIHWHLVTRTGLFPAHYKESQSGLVARVRSIPSQSAYSLLTLTTLLVGFSYFGAYRAVRTLKRSIPTNTDPGRPLLSRGLMGPFEVAPSPLSGLRDKKRRGLRAMRLCTTLTVLFALGVLIQGDTAWTMAIVAILGVAWYLQRRVALYAWQYLVASLCLAAACSLVVLFGLGFLWGPNYTAHGLPALDQATNILGLKWQGGVAYYSGFCIALVGLLFTFSLNLKGGDIAQRHWNLLKTSDPTKSPWRFRLAVERPMMTMARFWLLATGLVVAFEVWHVGNDGVRLTLFGQFADITMVVALILITLLGLAMLALAVGRSFGVLAICRFTLRAACAAQSGQVSQTVPPDTRTAAEEVAVAAVRPRADGNQPTAAVSIHQVITQSEVFTSDENVITTAVTTKKEMMATHEVGGQKSPQTVESKAEPKTDTLLRFPGGSALTPDFLSTPMLAFPGAGGTDVTQLRLEHVRWGRDLRDLLDYGIVSDRTLLALFALLTSEVSLIQNAILGVMLTTLTATGLVFVFPISDGDGLLLFNLLILTVTGFFSGYMTMRFETDEVLSKILCNRERKAELSLALFGYVAFPFTILAIAIAIADVPGVLNWGGGIFSALMEIAKPAALK